MAVKENPDRKKSDHIFFYYIICMTVPLKQCILQLYFCSLVQNKYFIGTVSIFSFHYFHKTSSVYKTFSVMVAEMLQMSKFLLCFIFMLYEVLFLLYMLYLFVLLYIYYIFICALYVF